MDKVTLILSALISVAFLLMIAPGVFAMNRGKILRNIALWVAIFLGLALAYQHVGPGQTKLPPSSMTEQPTESQYQ